jgi:hypothetical protein
MPRLRNALPATLAALLLLPATSGARSTDDETWIARYVESARRAASTEANGTSGRQVALADLNGRQGAKVRVTLRDGRLRRGQVERIEGDALLLRVNLPSGYARLRLTAPRIRDIVLE